MQAFNAAGKAPGVYMQEVDVPGPIPGVSTGIAAIVGPAQSGPLNTPVFVTNWTQFLETFGGYIYDPPVFAAHAVRGFFENGGSVCCFVRAGVARWASFDVKDRLGEPLFTVKARAEGVAGNNISVAVSEASLCTTKAQRCSTEVVSLSDNKLKLRDEDLKLFIPGDLLCIAQDGLTEEAEVAIISSATREVFLKAPLEESFSREDPAAGPIIVRLSDLRGKKRVRLADVEGIEAGSYLEFSQGGGSPEYAVVEGLDGKTVLLRLALQGDWSLDAENPVDVRSLEFTLEVTEKGKTPKTYEKLSTVPYHSRYYEKIVADSTLVEIKPADPPNSSLPPSNLPKAVSADLAGGKDDNPGGLNPQDYCDAIDALERVSINILCVPDAVSFDPNDPVVLKKAVMHCEKMGDRFAVLDCGRNLGYDSAIKQRGLFGDTSYAALYYPWIEIPHPAWQGRLKVPPSGHIAGVYARTDELKGVHKAPGNEMIKGCLGPASLLNDTEHGLLNEASVNAIISVPGSGTLLMGARTLSAGTQWRYINVRRLLLYIEKSIQNATRFAVFQPNNPSLWATVKRQVSDFLNNVWRSGALFGATPDQAFWVKVDEELNPPSVRALGQLIIEVVLFPVTPAEYIVFRVIQQPGGASVSE
jgi:phage tail sheath protein FI